TNNMNTNWDLSDLYKGADAWTAAYDALKTRANKLDSFKGTIGMSAGAMRAALDEISDVNRQSSRLYVYASLKADEDILIAENQERKQLSSQLSTLIGEKTSWLAPEILEIGEAKVRGFIAEDKNLAALHRFYLEDTLRSAPHSLGTEAEGVLASAS